MAVYRIACLLCGLLIFSGNISFAGENTPHEINGFVLGSSIEEYDFITYRNFLKDVIIGEVGGFRKGIISYGVCDQPGKIVRIKMKYKDSSRKFYKQLLKRFEKKFGEPDEFTGDAFGIVLEWKWRFTDKDNNYITLTLQHNLKNLDKNIGNMVKLTMPERIKAERLCFKKTCGSKKMDCPLSMQDDSWENLIPR
jgi:hypothetical protein